MTCQSSPLSISYWPTEWDRLSAPTSEDEAYALVKACRRRLPAMLTLIRRQFQKGSARQAKRLVRRLLHSDSAKVAAMAVAFAKRGLKEAPRLDVVKKALALRLDKPSGEIIRKDLRERADGKFRLIYSFGPLEYARQYLVLRVVEIFVPISGSQFMHSGGTPAAARWLNANVRSRTWVTTTDIPDCFLRQSRVSLESGGLLPKPVMTSVLYDAMRMAKQGISKVGGELASLLQQEVFSDVGPVPERGIPPGSAPSSLLADARLGELARTAESAAEDVLVGNYLDNFIILAPSKKAADVTFETLCQAILTEYGPEAVAQVRHRRKTTQARAGF